MKKFLRRVKNWLDTRISKLTISQTLLSLEFSRLLASSTKSDPYNLSKGAFKTFSQCEEDYILLEILKRLGISSGILVEIGVGNLTENNTIRLLLEKRFKICWIDVDFPRWFIAFMATWAPENFHFVKRFISTNNICATLNGVKDHFRKAGNKNIDLRMISIDIDTVDAEIFDEVVKNFDVDIIICEYNSLYGSTAKFSQCPSDTMWDGSGYSGTSLSNLAQLASGRFSLVYCSLSGVNAFFVSDKYKNIFSDSFSVETVFRPARYHLTKLSGGHNVTPKLIKKALLFNG